MKIRQGFVSNSSTSSFVGIGWSTYDINAAEFIIGLVKEIGLPEITEDNWWSDTVKELTKLVNNDLDGDISKLTNDILEESGFEENELLEYLISAYPTKMEYHCSGYDDHSIGIELPSDIKFSEYLNNLNNLQKTFESDPIYNYMLKYTGKEPLVIAEAWFDN